MPTLLNKIEKHILRKQALKKRQELYSLGVVDVKSFIIRNSIKSSKIFQEAKNIALYYPYKSEVDLVSVLNTKNKNFYLPQTVGNNLEFHKYEGKIEIGEFDIPVATGEIINPKDLDIIYIPALMANSKGYRLGFGKGFYDNFFRQNIGIKAKKVIILLSNFVNDEFIEDDYDEKCDMVQTEYYCKIC